MHELASPNVSRRTTAALKTVTGCAGPLGLTVFLASCATTLEPTDTSSHGNLSPSRLAHGRMHSNPFKNRVKSTLGVQGVPAANPEVVSELVSRNGYTIRLTPNSSVSVSVTSAVSDALQDAPFAAQVTGASVGFASSRQDSAGELVWIVTMDPQDVLPNGPAPGPNQISGDIIVPRHSANYAASIVDATTGQVTLTTSGYDSGLG